MKMEIKNAQTYINILLEENRLSEAKYFLEKLDNKLLEYNNEIKKLFNDEIFITKTESKMKEGELLFINNTYIPVHKIKNDVVEINLSGEIISTTFKLI